MRPYSPRCVCGLIILVSSSNKAVALLLEINGHEKLGRKKDRTGEEYAWECCGVAIAACRANLSLRKEKKREERRRHGGSHGWISAPIGRMWSNNQYAFQCVDSLLSLLFSILLYFVFLIVTITFQIKILHNHLIKL